MTIGTIARSRLSINSSYVSVSVLVELFVALNVPKYSAMPRETMLALKTDLICVAQVRI